MCKYDCGFDLFLYTYLVPSVPQCNPSCEVLQKCDEADRCNTDSCQDYLDEKQGMKPKTDCMFYCSKDYCKCTTDFKRSPITQTCIQKELCPAAIKQHNAAFESQNPYPDSSIDPDPFGKLAQDTPPTLWDVNIQLENDSGLVLIYLIYVLEF